LFGVDYTADNYRQKKRSLRTSNNYDE